MEKKYLSSTGLERVVQKISDLFAKVGHTHTKSQITDFPTIPTKTSQLTNDSGFKTTDNNTTYTLAKDGANIVLTGTDGSVQSVIDSDTTITVDSSLSSSSTNPVQNKAVNSALSGKVPTSRTVNGKALTGNITLTASDIGADASGAAATALTNAKAYTDGEVGAVADDLSEHTTNTSNPHNVTKSQVGLGNVPNVSTNNQAPTYTQATTLANLVSGETLSTTFGKIMKAIADLISHLSNTSNPHGVTKTQVGLGNVNNTSDANKPVSTAQATAIADAKKAGIDAQADIDAHIDDSENPHGVTVSQIGAVPTSRTVNGKALSANITLSASDVKADASGTASSAVSTHNTSTSAHSDIRALIDDLSTKLSNFLDVDDTTTDQLSEVLTLIENNKGTLESLTSSKVNVSDIINNLTTNNSSKVLSAAQGVAIKSLIDALDAELESHTHAIADVSGLQTALDGKAASSHGTHVSYSTTAPVMDGTASVGSASTVARSDHKHPTDTSRAAKADFDSHTGNTTMHITATERTNWGTAYTHSQASHAPSNAEKNQNAFSNIAVNGQTTVAADAATDTVTFAGSNVTITTDATNDKVTFSVANGTTSAKGVVQLTNSTSSTSTTTAATPSSVKSAYDLANTANTAAAAAQSTADGKADASHTHKYAGSSSAGGAATSANKVNSALTVKLNSGSTEGTNQFTFDGSAAKSFNITASAIGAAASSHTHDDRYYTESEVDTKLSGKASSSHALSKGSDNTASKTLSFGGTFTAVTDTAVSGHKITDTTTTYTMPSDRLFTTLVPTGTAIGSNADLNTVTYLKVGRYYCSANKTVATLTNCPASDAFMMEVYSPLSTTIDNETTKTWVYRLRQLTTYTGTEYIQYCYAGATAGSWIYGAWVKKYNDKHFSTSASLTSGTKIGSITIDGDTTTFYAPSAYTHPSYTARTGKPTANQTPAFGGTATVSQITSDATGHVTGATDRTITIPSTLSNGTGTAGLIKTSSTVTSSSGYTACPVINGVPYYKDTNNTYSLSSFGITATAAELNKLDGVTATATELNYVDGVTSNIQTQLNGKAPSSHGTHVPSCSASNNGQFLRVVNGAAAWQTVSSAEGVSF